MTDFKALFKQAVEAGASDIHLHAGRRPVIRVNGSLKRVSEEPVAPGEMHAQITQMLPDHLKGQMSAQGARGLDFSFTDCNHGRVDFESSVPGYGSGHMDLTRITQIAGLACP